MMLPITIEWDLDGKTLPISYTKDSKVAWMQILRKYSLKWDYLTLVCDLVWVEHNLFYFLFGIQYLS